jgi:hypothetical protein
MNHTAHPEAVAMPGRALQWITATRLLLDVMFYFGLVGAAGIAIWLALSPLVMRDGRPGNATLPVAVGEGVLYPTVDLAVDRAAAPEVTQAVLVGARGELRIETTDWSLQFLPNLGMLLALGIVLAIVNLLRRMLRTVRAGDPFTEVNGRRLRAMGLLLLAVGVIGPLLEYLLARAMLARIPVADLTLVAPLDAQTEVVLAGLLLLVLSAVFARGAELERYRSLTI